MDVPEIIKQLAAQAGGTPIAWHEYDDHFVIVFEDGRKLIFNKIDPGTPRHEQSPATTICQANREHVGKIEPTRKTTKTNKGD